MSNFKTIILTIISLFAAITIFAAERFPSPDYGEYHYMHDYAGILSEEDRYGLEYFMGQMEDSLYVQVAIVTMDSLSYDTNIDDYATDLFTAWGIGSKKTDGGILILCVMSSHEVVIRTGYGVEGALPDATCISIIHNTIAPNFREGNYFKGLEIALFHMYDILKGEFTAEDLGYDTEDDDVNVWVVLGIAAAIFILPLFLPKRYRSAYYAFLLDVLISAIFSRGGGGGSSSGGGGGRSFGGGRTGGGGARGSW